MAFPSISAVAAGYKVYAVVDASGNSSVRGTDLTIARIVQAGVTPIDTLAVISELQQTWNRPEAISSPISMLINPAALPVADRKL